MNNKDKIIIDLCGGTGAWSRPYRKAGYRVEVIDIKNSITQDVTDKLYPISIAYLRPYGILAAPPCPHFSFCRTNAKEKRNLREAMRIVIGCLSIIWQCQYGIDKDTQKYPPLKFWALENPNRAMLKWFLGKPAFIFQPYEFGDNYKKETALWGMFNEPKKKPIKCTKPKFDKLSTKEIHGEYYDKYNRQTRRAITPKGFAQAFYEANK